MAASARPALSAVAVVALIVTTLMIPAQRSTSLLQLSGRGATWQRLGTQYSTVQYSTVQYSTVQYSTVQYSTCGGSVVAGAPVSGATTSSSSFSWNSVVRFSDLIGKIFVEFHKNI